MIATNSNNSHSPVDKPAGFRISTIIIAGLIAGILDICAACLYSYIKKGPGPAGILQYISNTVFGKAGIANQTLSAISGLLIHFSIAMLWAVIFFILYPRLKIMRLNKIITAIGYGLFVWIMMNMVIVPLWRNKAFVFKPEPALINAAILIVAIGMPLSFIAHKYYSVKDN
ncbi:MAG: hypothetical protein ABI685_05055 [Ferruginibacter sp.]